MGFRSRSVFGKQIFYGSKRALLDLIQKNPIFALVALFLNMFYGFFFLLGWQPVGNPLDALIPFAPIFFVFSHLFLLAFIGYPTLKGQKFFEFTASLEGFWKSIYKIFFPLFLMLSVVMEIMIMLKEYNKLSSDPGIVNFPFGILIVSLIFIGILYSRAKYKSEPSQDSNYKKPFQE